MTMDTIKKLFDDYPKDSRHISDYIKYQLKYHCNIRQSDKKIAEIVGQELNNRDGKMTLLDIGCSTGALLKHLRSTFPNLHLTGVDLSEQQIDTCRANPELVGVEFANANILSIEEFGKTFDIVVTNAVLYGFGDDEFEQSLQQIYHSLNDDGLHIAFDFMNPYDQEVQIIEKSDSFPGGHPLHFRSRTFLRKAFEAAGFTDVVIKPFELRLDLEDKGSHSINTRTVKTVDGGYLMFRGVINQPWAHFVARKSSPDC